VQISPVCIVISSVDMMEYPKLECSESCDTRKFSEISDNVSQIVQDRHILTMKY